jgi:hypothetical protein
MAISKNNFSHKSGEEFGSVDVTFVNVDFKNAMNAETGDVTSGSAVAGLELVRNTFGNEGIQILGDGALKNGNTSKVYMVRADSLDTLSATTSLARLQAAIRALDGGDNITATVSAADVASKDLSDTSEGVS